MKNFVNIVIASIFIFYLTGTVNIHAQEIKAENIKVEWSNDDKLIITYDLPPTKDKTINIRIWLMSNDNPNLKIEVKSASGQIGNGKFGGSGNKVVWEINKDFPNVKEGESYYFTLEASVVKEDSGGIPWYYYVGGGVIAGTAALLIVNSKESTPSSDGNSESGFPRPPDR